MHQHAAGCPCCATAERASSRAPDDPAPHPRLNEVGAAAVLSLQRSIGNHATALALQGRRTARSLLQRKPPNCLDAGAGSHSKLSPPTGKRAGSFSQATKEYVWKKYLTINATKQDADEAEVRMQCHQCKKFKYFADFDLDHIKPWEKHVGEKFADYADWIGPGPLTRYHEIVIFNDADNLRPVCGACNSTIKGTKDDTSAQMSVKHLVYPEAAINSGMVAVPPVAFPPMPMPFGGGPLPSLPPGVMHPMPNLGYLPPGLYPPGYHQPPSGM